MDSATILLDQQAYQPHEQISGTVQWSSSEKTTSFVLRLIHFTEGRGTQDTVIEQEHTWNVSSNSDGTEPFNLPLPSTPYSFSGQLISLQWAVEVIALPKKQFSIETPFTLSPTRQPLTLEAIESVQKKKKKRWWSKSNR